MANLVPRKLSPSLPAFDPLQRPKERAEALAQWWHERALVRFVSDGTRQLWHQLRGETDDEFAAFGYWYETLPRGNPLDPALAIRHNWQQRADALDRYLDIWHADDGNEQRRMANAVRCGLDAMAADMRKLRDKALTSAEQAGTHRDHLAFMQMALEFNRNAPKDQTLDLGHMAPDRAQLLLELIEEATTKGTKS